MIDRNSTSASTELSLKIVIFSAITALTLLTIYKLKLLIVTLVAAITLASAIAPIAEAAERKRVPRLVTVVTIFGGALMIYILLAALLVPTLYDQWAKLVENFPSYIAVLEDWARKSMNLGGNSIPLSFSADDLRRIVFHLLRQTLDMTAGLVGLILAGILCLFLTGYFVVEADKIWKDLANWFPRENRTQVLSLIAPIEQRMGGYVRGQTLVALTVGVVLVSGLSLLGVKYGLLLGVLAGAFNIVPYIGSMIAMSCAVLVAFNQTPLLALGVLVLYGMEQWLESTVLVPYFLGKQVSLNPLVVLFAILAGASLMGLPGALISVPLASVAMFFAERFYLQRVDSNILEHEHTQTMRGFSTQKAQK